MTFSSLTTNKLIPTPFIPTFAATGGNSSSTLAINGVTFQYRVFTSTGTLTVTSAGFAHVLCIGGGGGGQEGGGGSGGGFVEQLVKFESAGAYTITIGAGGGTGANGSASSVGSLLSVPGGYYGQRAGGNRSGPTGTSGYGAQGPTSGVNGYAAQPGGNGAGTTFYSDTARFYAGGGGGGGYNGTPNTNAGGLGGGGGYAGAGSANTGGGGAGGAQASGGAAGGSGLVIVRYAL
jgi:hypothetical protein